MIHAQVSKRFGSGFALEIDLRASAGVTALFGPSGAGKTLLLNLIAGLEQPDAGRILLDNRILFDSGAGVRLAPRSRDCGYVFQNYALFPHMTLRENLAFAAERLPRLERHRRVNEMLDTFRLTESAGRLPSAVSGGQRQRCSIARALIGNPKLLLLDEPATGLDAGLRADLYAVLRQVREQFQTPILLVTHDLDECLELAGEMWLIADGRAIQHGSPEEVLAQPASLAAAQLLGAFNLLPAEISALDPGRNTSTLQCSDFELQTRYLPGHLKGDRVTVCVRPGALRVSPGSANTGVNRCAGSLERAVPLSQQVRLEFTNGIRALVPSAEFVESREWTIECPSNAIQVL